MKMIGHEAVSRAEQAFARGGVKHQLAETGVESVVEPAGGAIHQWQGPMNNRVTVIPLAR
jgi:hypothetical protein